jgi:hypothetical protein
MILLHVPNKNLEPCSQVLLIHNQSLDHLILFTCIELSNLQMS